MIVSENSPETKKKKKKSNPKSFHHTLLQRNWNPSELLNYLNTTKKWKFASIVYQREMKTSFNELFRLTRIDFSQLISTSQYPIAFIKVTTNTWKLRKW